MKILFPLIITLTIINLKSLAQQDTVRPIHSLTIYKAVNDNNHRKNISIEIDSVGRIYIYNKLTSIQLNIQNLNAELTKYCSTENIKKYPGSNDLVVRQTPTPNLNEQNIVISIKFLDDVNVNDKNLINKTYYSWGKAFDKNINSYPLFNYLNEEEVIIFKALLE